MAVQIQFRRGTAASWTSANTVLAAGELGLETDTALFKIGDGTTAWTSLGYGGFDGTATLSQIGISTGTDIGGAIADDDEIALYDTSVSANRKADASRVKTYVFNVVDAAGDLLVGTAADTVGRLAIGTNGYFLKSNGTTAVWDSIPTINTLDDVGDVTITSVASGQFIKWNGTAWVNDAIDLGTDTTGNYMSGVSAGTGISVTHTPGEGSTATIAVDSTVVKTSDTGTVTSTMLADGTIVNADINASAAIALSKLASGSSAQLIIANGSGVPEYVTLSGDATISNTGVLTLANSSLSLDELSDAVITSPSTNQLLQYNGTNWVNATVSTTPTWEDDGAIISGRVFG